MSKFPLSIREAQDTASKRTAYSIYKIIQFMFHRVPVKDKATFLARLKGKIINISPAEIGIKDLPPSAAIGQAVGVTKNLLSGLNPAFVKQVLIELIHILNMRHY